MHDHEFDLIAQLAEGSLPDEQREVAEAALATCEECREEYEAQAFALEALSEVQTAQLTEFERARLRRGVSEATRTPAPAPRRQLAAWIPKLAVAAVAVAFVGVVGINLSQQAGEDAAGEAAADSAVSELAFSDTTAAASEAMAAAEPEEAIESQDEMTAAAEATDLAGAASRLGGLLQPLDLGQIDANDLGDLSLQRAAPGDVPERSGIQPALEPFPFACVGTAVDRFGGEDELTVAGVGNLNGRLVEVLGFADVVLAFDRTTCEVVMSGTLAP